MVKASVCAILLTAAAGAAGPGAAQMTGGVKRTVYITVTDKQRQWVQDLTAADLIVKEGGKLRTVLSAEPAAGLVRVALLVEPSLLSDRNVHNALSQFVGKMQGHAEIGLMLASSRDVTVIEYTKDSRLLVDGIARLDLVRSQLPEHLGEGIFETARALGKSETRRRAIVALGVDRDQEMNMQAQEILDEIQRRGVTLFVASLPGPTSTMPVGAMGDASGLAQVLGDGSKESGGRRQLVTISAGFPDVLKQFADEILHQYEVTYVLPNGTKPVSRVSVSTTRRDLVVRAPSRISNR